MTLTEKPYCPQRMGDGFAATRFRPFGIEPQSSLGLAAARINRAQGYRSTVLAEKPDCPCCYCQHKRRLREMAKAAK